MPAPPALAPLDRAVDAMVSTLAAYLPLAGGALPDPTVSLTSLTERIVGLGNSRGSEPRGELGSVDLRGLRLDAVVRFQVWAGGPAESDAVLSALVVRLAVNIEALRAHGFLKLALDTAPPPELVSSLSAWRKHADYRVLYEFAYADTDGAAGLIARIPILIDGAFDETTVVTDRLVRWDDLGAPALVVRGPFRVGSLAALLFLPGPPASAPSGSVTLTRTFDGAVGAPALLPLSPPPLPALSAFIAAVGGALPTERHAQVVFPSFSAFVAAFAPAGDVLEMGDRDGDGITDVYEPLRAAFVPAIGLPDATDRLEVAYATTPFDPSAVLYLRALRG